MKHARKSRATVLRDADAFFGRMKADLESGRQLLMSREECAAYVRVGPMLLEAILACEPGELFDLSDWIKSNAPAEGDAKATLAALPFLLKSLETGEMEWVHERLGPLDASTVERLLAAKPGQVIVCQGVRLDKNRTYMRIRRRPLKTEPAVSMAELD